MCDTSTIWCGAMHGRRLLQHEVVQGLLCRLAILILSEFGPVLIPVLVTGFLHSRAALAPLEPDLI